MGTINYIAVVRQLENGRFLISFPDFEGISTTAETEENIQYIAAEVIKIKLTELKKANLEISVPKKITEVSKNLQVGEFTTYVFIEEDTTPKNVKNNKIVKDIFKNEKVIEKDGNNNKTNNETFMGNLNKFDDFIVNDVRKSVPEGKEHLLSIGGSILSIITSLVFPFYTFTGLWSFGVLGLHFFHLSIFYIILIIAFLILAGLTIYASLSKNMQILQISAFANIGLFAICYILVFITALGNPFLSMGMFKFVLYIISVALIYLGYRSSKAIKDSNK